uniref:DUF7753 domain-containing protein n=2 Tax=Caenorhabditis japonica TaxID=281687 RepID=A0A8R1DSR3_CAEJA
MENVKDLPEALDNSFFAKAEYQWWNVKDFSNMKCQNASNNGCGGYGNNCYFCDVCESLTDLEHRDDETAQNTLAGQLKGINCPQKPGFYTFRKEFCFNDWSAFDADGDCEMDFLQGDRGDYKSAFGSLQQVGYGSVIAKIRLAFNATGSILRKRELKEEQIEATVAKELEERRRTWDVNNGQFDKFSQWYIEYRKNLWHKAKSEAHQKEKERRRIARLRQVRQQSAAHAKSIREVVSQKKREVIEDIRAELHEEVRGKVAELDGVENLTPKLTRKAGTVTPRSKKKCRRQLTDSDLRAAQSRNATALRRLQDMRRREKSEKEQKLATRRAAEQRANAIMRGGHVV